MFVIQSQLTIHFNSDFMAKHKFLLLTGMFISLCSFTYAQTSAYQKGWESFTKNDRANARTYFNEALKDPQTKSDATLSLCLLDWSENKNADAFSKFMGFYNSDSAPYSYLYSLWALPFLPKPAEIYSPEALAFYEKIVANPQMNGTLKSMIYQDLGEYYAIVRNQKKSADYFSKMGAITQWQVLGSFDNTSGSGFSKDWGAISHSKPEDTFKNKVNADIHWYTPTFNKANNWFAFDYYFYLQNAIMYAQSFVNSATAQEAYLRVGTSGSLKVWINDALVSSVIDEHNCDLDVYNYKVKLNEGNNRIVVQIGCSDINQANFLLRLTDEKGNPLPNISSSSVNAPYTTSTATNSCEQLPFFPEEFFKEKIAKNPENPLNYFLLSEVYLRNDKSHEAIKTLKQEEDKFGKSTLSAYRLYEGYMRAQNKTDYEQEMENIKNTDPNSSFALQSKFDDLIESEKYSEAEDVCKTMKDLYGESDVTDGWDLKLLSYQKKFDELIALAKKLYLLHPNRADYMNLNYLIENNVTKNPKSAIAIIEKYSKRIKNNDVEGILAKAYLDQGNTVKGLATLQQRINDNPFATGYYDDMIGTLLGMQQYSSALVLANKAAQLAPYIPNIYTRLGFIYKNMNQTEQAKDNFQKSIYYGPTSYDSREQLRLLENKKEIYDLFPKSDLQSLIKTAPTATDYPEDNSIILLNEYQYVIYPEGAKEYRCELATKILNQSGIDAWKEYGVGYNGYTQKLIIDKAEVIKANGNIVKAETDNDNQVVFTNLEVNDVLHLEYRIQDMSTGKLASHFFDKFLLQYSIPTLISRYNVLIPDDKKFSYQVTNGAVEPKVTTIENMKLYSWELDNQPAVKNEPHEGSLYDIAPTLHISSLPDWQYVSDWYRDLTTSKFKSDYVLDETLKEILKDKQNLTQLQKAKLFYDYILNNIAYSSVDFLQSNFIPQKASRTITTRLGDCKDLSTLFVALCRESGINANLVLILTRDNGSNTMPLPTIDFNHCIAQLNIDNKQYYLELTDNTLPFGAALKEDLKAQILPIPFGDDNTTGSQLIRMQMADRISNSSARKQTIRFDNNNMQISRNIVYYGAMASYQRSDYKNVGADEQLKNMNQAVAGEFKVAAKVTDLQFGELATLADSVTCKYNVDVKNAMQEVAGMKIMKLPWTDINSLELVAAESRKYPMEYWNYQAEDKTTEVIEMDIPQGKKLAETPQNISYECPSAVYTLTFNTKIPGKVIVTRYFARKQDRISTADYPAFRDFLNKVSETDNKQYALK